MRKSEAEWEYAAAIVEKAMFIPAKEINCIFLEVDNMPFAEKLNGLKI